MANIKELTKKPELLSGGHRLCPGCGAPIVVRQVLAAVKTPVVIANATGCVEVSTSIYPYTSWNCSWIHVAFENAAAVISGVETMYRSLKKQGKITDDYRFIAFGGDGGTYDIGIQALSGMLERGHQCLYVCYNNEAYQNTGAQRSGATPKGADTTTSPVGKAATIGKSQERKDMTAICVAHNVPYVAQASPAHWNDLITKVEKALNCGGASFMNIIAPCHRGWRYNPEDTIQIARLAVQTCVWLLYEVENGKYKITYRPKEKLPVIDWLKSQGRFRHLFKPENAAVIEEIQKKVDAEWEKLQKLESI